MQLSTIDLSIIIFFLLLSLTIGVWVSRRAGKNTSEFFLSGRSMPWWLLGMSMVATTFSTDTPNLVTDLVRQDGVSGNWVWWAFLLTGMLTVFIYARLWRKSGVHTDIEFYELRYSGKGAAFLRGFRAIYLGLVFNVMIMASVTLAAIKIGEVLFGVSPEVVISIAAVVTLLFSTLGGFRGVILTDFILFFTAMIGSFAAAAYALNLPEVNGLSNLVNHPAVRDHIALFPSPTDREQLIMILVIPLAVQWWSAWYPGAEPGGGGYIAQRMLAARNEKHAMGATLFFNIAHYALRPWPWIIVALCSLIVYPDIASIQEAFPAISEDKLGEDLAYPAMLIFLPAGLLGLVIASLIAAYMSTISTHLNWGASYIVYDFYKRFVKPDATEKHLVLAGRITTILMMVLAGFLALGLRNAVQIFRFIILFGAGTGLIFILRWFWWRINAWSEIVAMIASGIIAIAMQSEWLSGRLPGWAEFPVVVLLTTLIWITATIVTRPTDTEKLKKFYNKVKPGGPGWKRIRKEMDEADLDEGSWSVPNGILAMLAGTLCVYGFLLGTGYLIYAEYFQGVVLTGIGIVSAFILTRLWKKVSI